MADTQKPLLIKRYASRRLYNTETSDYVTLEDIARFIREGREVQIIDLKSGDDLTRQYLLQIVAEHESRGENVLPLAVLTDLVRSYTSGVNSVVPQFLAASFEMLQQNQAKMMENFSTLPIAQVPGFDAMRKQQEAFMKSMMSGWGSAPQPEQTQPDDLAEIKRQLAELQSKLAKL
ncbi:polyhydroxyalkanoate synthesis repressor PhaR [Cereibacter sp. SYSU M97828]|nr:polyhydroxyalkanoate synthesis repressor PhaR [Cereibacter flavus]